MLIWEATCYHPLHNEGEKCTKTIGRANLDPDNALLMLKHWGLQGVTLPSKRDHKGVPDVNPDDLLPEHVLNTQLRSMDDYTIGPVADGAAAEAAGRPGSSDGT